MLVYYFLTMHKNRYKGAIVTRNPEDFLVDQIEISTPAKLLSAL